MADIHSDSIQGIPEPLSTRERDILALLAENLSNREIADRLFLAYTTVKWYNRQIFGKLGVENREQAVQRAFALDLLTVSRSIPAVPSSLPVQLTPFIGRDDELEALSSLFSLPHNRLLTILAPGGMGKTRLALAAAEQALGQFEHGISFIPLAPLTTTDQLVPAIADAIGLHFSPDHRPPQRQLLDFLSARNTLLVLDNFEHLLDGAVLVAELLNAAPRVKALVTSRERLNLAGETIFTLGGLPYPEQFESENPLNFSAVKLFVQCARRANSHFVASDEASIAHVCQLVQGMPLALELAAAWVGALSPAEIAAEIIHSADFLHTTMRNAPERLRSIRAVFEATWRRLTPDERQAFRRLSIFRGGCTREAAQAVAGVDLSTLAGLVDKALLRRSVEGRRYEIHELLRQYAAEQLDAAHDFTRTRNAHRDYFGKLAQVWSNALKTPQQLEALDVLEADFDNLREAFRHAIENRQADVIEPFTDLWWFYEMRGRNAEGLATIGAAIEAIQGQDSLALAKLLVGQAIFHERFYQFDLERQFAEQSIAILQRLGAAREMAFSQTALAVALSSLDDYALAEPHFQEALELAQRYDDPWVTAILLICFGANAMNEQRFDEAKQLNLQAYALCIKMGNFWALSRLLGNLGYMALDDRDYAEAKRFFDEAVVSAQKVHHLNWLCDALHGLVMTALAQGDFAQAWQHAEMMRRISSEIGERHEYFKAIVGLAEIASMTGNDVEARQHLREALRLVPHLDEQAFFQYLGLAAIPLLFRLQALTQAVLVIGFLQQHPTWISSESMEWEKLQGYIEQIQAQLPADTYAVAWNEGQTLTLDTLLSILHAVI